MSVWESLREMDRLRQEMDRAFEGVAPWAKRPLVFLPAAGARQYPRVNITPTPEGYLVEALAPGVSPESLEVNLQGNVVTIAGEKPAPEGVQAAAFHRNERAAGRFIRTLELPQDLDPAKVRATYTDGLLRLALPRAEAAKPRRIAIDAG